MEARMKLSEVSTCPLVDATFYKKCYRQLKVLGKYKVRLGLLSWGYEPLHGGTNYSSHDNYEANYEICAWYYQHLMFLC